MSLVKEMLQSPTIHRTKATRRERLHLAVVELMGLLDALVFLGSLTLLTSELRTRALFDWFDNDKSHT